MTTTTLDWRGPLIVGQQLPTCQHEVDLLKEPGVYLYYREYINGDYGNLVAYVGLGKEILARYKTWLNRFCSLQNKTRRSNGGDYSEDDDRQYFGKVLMNFDESIEVARQEVLRTRFHYAFTPDYKNVEGYLIKRLEQREENTKDSHRKVLFGNTNHPSSTLTYISHSFLGLNELQDQHGTLAYILDAATVPAYSCAACLCQKWVCVECGASSSSGTADIPPEKCPNYNCDLRKFRHATFRLCCECHNQPSVTTCEHCGKQATEVVA